MCVVCRGKFWVFGGSTGDDSYDHTITDKVQAYNPRTQTWSVEKSLTSPRHKVRIRQRRSFLPPSCVSSFELYLSKIHIIKDTSTNFLCCLKTLLLILYCMYFVPQICFSLQHIIILAVTIFLHPNVDENQYRKRILLEMAYAYLLCS